MGQLRDTIRTMVRNEFASRMIEEAKGSKYNAKSVYRSSKYIDRWNDMPTGKPTNEVAPSETKHDFVRWVMSMIRKGDAARSTESIYFVDSEAKDRAIQLLSPLVKNPDEFAETLNRERAIVFGQGDEGGKLRTHPDPVSELVTIYNKNKSALAAMANVELQPGETSGEEASASTDAEGEYDIIPGTTSKADIARMLAQDPSETKTEQSVVDRLKKAMRNLTNEQNIAILQFIKDPDMDSADKKELIANLEKLNGLVNVAAKKYSEMFVKAHIAAAKTIKNVENFDQVEKARDQGNKKFVDDLKAAGIFSLGVNRNKLNPAEFNVFDAALDAQEGRNDVHGMIVVAAKKPEQADIFRDEAIASVMNTFLEEQDQQTNFNTLGDFTDTLPATKEVRQNIFNTLQKRGRKKGSTKEVLAAKKAAAAAAAKSKRK